MPSFQELYKLARAKAFSKPKTKAVKAPKPKKVKAPVVDDPATRAKAVLKARKQKRLEDGDDEPKINYQVRPRSGSREKPFPNRPLDLDTMIKVQVDAKTWVYVKPDADIEAVKEKYRKRPLIKDKDDVPPRYDF